jgi:hypothetical protein
MNKMQQDSENSKTAIDDVLITLSKPLSSTVDHQIKRMQKSLLLLNQLVMVSLFSFNY